MLKDLFVTALHIQKELNASDTAKVVAARKFYWELPDIFYDEYRDTIAPRQYEATKATLIIL